MEQKILYRGAEAVIILKKNQVIKRRTRKSYRIKELDEKIRKLRTRAETKLLEKAGRIFYVPKIVSFDEKSKEIIMKFINGKKLSEYLDSFLLKKQLQICENIGKSTAKLHDADIIHGDLTTSNMILYKEKIYFIDFGLGFHSKKIEDKAVDIHLLKQALESRHFSNWKKLFNAFLNCYRKSKNSSTVLAQLKKVEARRRYKH